MQETGEPKEIGVGEFWRAIGCRAIGAAVVAARGAGGPAGFLALSTSHLCASPPIVMASVGRSTSASGVILEAGAFAISFLPKGRAALADMFGGKGPLKGADRFDPADWGELATGAPVLRDAVGVFDCRLEEAIERHETLILLGRLVAWRAAEDAAPLIFHAGRMG